ncbi:hypothetical protein SCP_0400080 [Sparassis crispa]|uniref:Uncharacterized protein n=1 Tax=Sparassis crispa TaxID=139825 RepID=A0A401GHG0_9APHY|nr:hypothetical protein SCP_0400080 [Sparassis crispa]GBE81637.1 hypothetical protein SCP_0400080 [Sparassis crispa]
MRRLQVALIMLCFRRDPAGIHGEVSCDRCCISHAQLGYSKDCSPPGVNTGPGYTVSKSTEDNEGVKQLPVPE